ncbi:PAS domain-containing hybrid sensor histidine kinase/response regulator [Sphingomonas sp. Leaf231]|uniref:PAS domain-containing hybrid sensor histidine kinase/response regulator n=1 Tax=Sphingomonas sp. Leaf231 TaxID=1736301 RepID=UPI0006FD197D|nr:PAS domain S-box protein [Sphingomonas sp. Leaf231]
MNSIERRLNAIVANSRMAIFLMDDRQQCIFMNEAAEALTGYRLDEVLDRPLHDVVHHQHPDGRSYALAECPIDRAFPECERMQGEEVFVHKDGHFYPVAFTASPIAGDDGEPVGTIIEVRDLTEEKARDAALKESESRFRNMADHAPVMMWVTDPSGFCTYLNRQWYEFTGQTDAEAQGYGWLEATHPDDRQRAEDMFVSANALRSSFRIEYRLKHASGAYRWAIDAASPRFGDDGEYLGYVGSVIDIDERREAEERLALSEEQLRLALDVAEIGEWDVDHISGSMFWPPRVKAMFGISPDVPVTLDDFHNGVHPDDRERTRAAYESASDPDRRALYDVEYRTVGREDGVVRWVAAKGRGLFDAHGACFRVIGTAIDITARKAAEIRLQQLNELLEQEVAERTAERNRVWEMSRDLLGIMGFDGFLKAINPAWQTTLGRDTETLLALSFREQVHPDDHQAVVGAMERLRRGETVEGFEDRIAHADGSWRWISWTLVPEGEVFYAVGRDVTLAKEAALELALAQESLRQSQKMEAIGQLTGGVAHDFNNLLTPIMGSLDLLQRKRLGNEREQRLIEGAIHSADRARALVQRLLAFARRQPLQPAAVDIGALVEGMADLLASTTGPQVRVLVEVADDLPHAKADANQLEMALLNLGVNARDAMPHGGTLRITATRDSVRTPRDGLGRGHYVRLSVADTGIGMDAATLARAVEPFFSTKGVGKGTGLGLSMAHGLAAQLGGALFIHSRERIGTNVELWLPVSASAMGIDDPSPVPLPDSIAGGLILLVDDEEIVRTSTADMLTEFGYEVREASSGEAALDLVAQGVTPDLLVTDHLMPGMSGVDLAVALRRMLPELPVLIVSGYSEVEDVTPGLPRLTKPFRSAELAASLAAVLVKRA